jgi:hypothetical protein
MLLRQRNLLTRILFLESAEAKRYAFADNNPLTRVDPIGLAENNVNDWYDPLQAIWDFGRAYRDMRNANTIGADKYFHCLAHCRAAKKGATATAAALGLGREIFDNVKNLYTGNLGPIDQIMDSAKDMVANAQGLACPKDKTCEQQCSQYVVPGLLP